MKEITKSSRLVGMLEKMFKMLNEDFFDGQLEMPIITVTATAKAYAHYTPWSAWSVKDEGKREINISSAYLDRDISYIAASMLHECVHMYNDTVLNVQDTSREGTYHNRLFKEAAETHGLIVTRTEKYGYSKTEPSDELLLWVLEHDELREIEICRTSPSDSITGTHANNSSSIPKVGTNPMSHTIKYQCPCCHNSVRATKVVNIACIDCMNTMLPV